MFGFDAQIFADDIDRGVADEDIGTIIVRGGYDAAILDQYAHANYPRTGC